MSSTSELNFKIRDGESYKLNIIRYWNRFVDVISIIWVIAFTISFLASDLGVIIIDINMVYLIDNFTFFILPVFVVDLMVKYYLLGHSRTFFRKHWISILLVIPYFRVFKMLSFIKFINITKLIQITQVTKPILNMIKVIHKTSKLKR